MNIYRVRVKNGKSQTEQHNVMAESVSAAEEAIKETVKLANGCAGSLVVRGVTLVAEDVILDPKLEIIINTKGKKERAAKALATRAVRRGGG